MLKYKFSLVLLFVLFSCNTKNRIEEEPRIIYELSDFETNYILNYFAERFNNDLGYGDNYDLSKQYTQIKFHGIKGEYYIITFDEKNYYAEDYVERTNRFLKLSDKLDVPIVFYEDMLLSNKERKLATKVGGGKASKINLDGSIQMITRM